MGDVFWVFARDGFVSVWDFCAFVLLVWFDWQFVLVVACLGVSLGFWVGCMV